MLTLTNIKAFWFEMELAEVNVVGIDLLFEFERHFDEPLSSKLLCGHYRLRTLQGS
jgi:hypothetical protein